MQKPNGKCSPSIFKYWLRFCTCPLKGNEEKQLFIISPIKATIPQLQGVTNEFYQMVGPTLN